MAQMRMSQVIPLTHTVAARWTYLEHMGHRNFGSCLECSENQAVSQNNPLIGLLKIEGFMYEP